MRGKLNKMKTNRIIGALVGLALLALCLVAAGVVCAYLTEYGARRFIIAAAIAAAGTFAAAMVYRLVSRSRHALTGWILLTLVVVLLLAPLLSTVWPGKITYARFGFTVYGLVPVPALDITIGPHGGLWFRDKSHFVSADEVQRLLTPDVEIVVIGTGWHSAVRVDPAIEQLEGYEVYVLPTPDAFDLYNRCVSEGKRVVLIAHSTC
jgi:hypothetical protein